jgi:hypothetical protein
MVTTKAKQAKQLLNKIAPKGEKLAYINSKEADLLKSVGGSGNITPQGIPSFEWTGGVTSSATSDASYSDNSSSDDSSSSDNTPAPTPYVDARDDPGNARNAPDYSQGDPNPGGTWQIDEKTNTIKFVESTDTITSYSDNLKAQIKADPLISALSPLGTLGKVGIQTLAANYMLGNIKNPIGSWKSPANDYYNPTPQPDNTSSDNNDNQVSATTQASTQDLTPQVTQQSPAADYYANIGSTTNNQSSFQSDLDAARITQKGLLSTPSSIGLLAINESPFYDFLKQNKLDRRIL